MTQEAPAWLVAWREGRTAPAQAAQPPTQRESSTRRHATGGKRRAAAVAAANRPKADQLGFVYPEPWTYDGGARREPVLDVDYCPPRVVRRVGWRSCMACGSPFFSEDVVALRLCNGPNQCRQ